MKIEIENCLTIIKGNWCPFLRTKTTLAWKDQKELGNKFFCELGESEGYKSKKWLYKYCPLKKEE